jgi:hypothetical protein
MYKNKYIKYKNKYLNLREKLKLQIGGGPPIIQNINLINQFTPGSDMEEYLNPIYGLYMYKSGYITNTFWLQDKEFNDSKNRKNLQVFNLSRSLDNKIQPNYNVRLLSSFDIGTYIALLYICKNNSAFLNPALTASGQYRFNLGEKVTKNSSIDEKKLQEYASKSLVIKKEIPLNPIKPLELLDFRIILYCLWWILDNDNDIIQYYIGIKDIFNIYNKYYPEKAFYINSDHKLNPNFNFDTGLLPIKVDSFEETLIKITTNYDFDILNTQVIYTSYKDEDNKPLAYSDCGEVTGRNLINLICFDGDKFDIKILQELGAIPELIEYYRAFSNFEKQSKLNSRDAWSKLIMENATVNKNIRFSQRTKQAGKMIYYDMNSGMALDNTVSNFFQLISNLLPLVTEWSKITSLIIDDKTVNGIGDIFISDSKSNTYVIHCLIDHYYMSNINEKEELNIPEEVIDKYNSKQQFIILLLLNRIDGRVLTEENYMWVNYDTNNFPDNINYIINTNIILYIKLLKLSFTDLINEDIRRRIIIRLDIIDESSEIIEILQTVNTEVLNQYNYFSKNFNFLNKIKLTKLTLFSITDSTYKELDLRPLSRITSIGSHFLSEYKLNTIDLRALQLLEFIDSWFINNSSKLESIFLPINIKYISDSFLINCKNLLSINLKELIKLESIGRNFMAFCSNLSSIEVLGLINLESIGDSFLNYCKNLPTIIFGILPKLVSIGKGFMNGCSKLSSINLSGLINLKSFDAGFMNRCSVLPSIDFTGLHKIESIGDNFMNECSELSSIDLSPLINLKSIGKYFMSTSPKLTTIKLSGLQNLESIGDYFFNDYDRSKEITIDLSGLNNLKSIGNYFLGTDTSKIQSVNIKCSAKTAALIEKSHTYLKMKEESLDNYKIFYI